MLYGGYQHNIDKKGRIFIPSKLRDTLGDSFIICRGIYGKRCLCVYSMDEWNVLCEKISTLPSAKSIGLRRFLFDGAFNVEFDSQGRILIPQPLREFASLEGEAHIVGMNTNIEIWNIEMWNNECKEYTPENAAADALSLNF